MNKLARKRAQQLLDDLFLKPMFVYDEVQLKVIKRGDTILDTGKRRRAICLAVSPDGRHPLYISIAIACPKDNFSKRIARQLTQGRVLRLIAAREQDASWLDGFEVPDLNKMPVAWFESVDDLLSCGKSYQDDVFMGELPMSHIKEVIDRKLNPKKPVDVGVSVTVDTSDVKP